MILGNTRELQYCPFAHCINEAWHVKVMSFNFQSISFLRYQWYWERLTMGLRVIAAYTFIFLEIALPKGPTPLPVFLKMPTRSTPLKPLRDSECSFEMPLQPRRSKHAPQPNASSCKLCRSGMGFIRCKGLTYLSVYRCTSVPKKYAELQVKTPNSISIYCLAMQRS